MSRYRWFIVILVVVESFFNLNINAQCVLICNGDFEQQTPAIGPGGWGDRTQLTQIPCWNTTEADGQIEVWGTGYNGGNGATPSYSGNDFVELNANAVGTLFQNFFVTSGTSITISFAHRGRTGVDTMSVSIGPVGGPYQTLGKYGDGNTTWGYYTTTYVVPTSANYSLRFNAVSTANNNNTTGNFIDNVSVTTTPIWLAPNVLQNVTCNGGNNGSATANTFNAPSQYTFLWNPTGQTTQIATGLTVGTYSITVKDAIGCTNTRTVTITQPPAPTASISGNAAVCQNTTFPVVTFTGANGFAPYKFVYNLNGGTADTLTTTIGTTATITQSTTLQGTFTYSLLSVIDAHGCSNVQNGKVVVRVNPLPIITSTSDTICRAQGRAGTLVASGANSYSWSTGAITNSITQAPLATTTYTVIGNSLGCLDTAIGTIKVNPLPVVTSSNDVICKAQGRAGTLTVSGANTYLWSTGATTNSITVAPLLTTSYSVTGTTLGCTGSSTSTITVNPIPVVIVAPAIICFGQSATLIAGGANSYTWSTGAVTNTIIASPGATTTYTIIGNSLGCLDTTTAQITVNSIPIVTSTSDTICRAQGRAGTLVASGANSYSWSTGSITNSITQAPLATTTYTVIGNSLGCKDTAIGTIKVNPLPVVTSSSDAICKAQGRAGTLIVSGATSYLWSTGATTNSITIAPLFTSTYSVTGTTLGCTGSSTGTITVNPIPVVTVAPATICFGQSATLIAGGANSYTWSTGAVTNTIIASPGATTTYTIIGNSLGCIDTTTAQITVNSIPIVTSTSDTICRAQGRAGTLVASGANSYSWSTGSITNSITQAPLATTTYTVIGNILGCLDTAIGTIKVNPLPVVTSSSDAICKAQGRAGTLTASGANTYLWSTGATINSITVAPLLTSTYSVTGTTLGCTGSSTGTITVNPIPVVTVAPATICFGQSATLIAGGANSYSWSTGAVTNTITASPGATTTYTIIGNSLGCLDTTTTSIMVNPLPIVTVTSDTICRAQGRMGTIAASGANSYSWSTGATTNSITQAPLTTTTYTVIGNSLGCFGNAISTIKVNRLPIVSVVSATICKGNGATLVANGANSYVWSTGAPFRSITVSPSNTTSYSVTGNSLGCTGSSTATITVNPYPVVTVTSDTICKGATGSLVASGADSYLWSTGTTLNIINKAPVATTNYTVTGTSLNCSRTVVGTINVLSSPTAVVMPASVCKGQSATLYAFGAPAYKWYNGSTASSLKVSPTTTTTYSVQGIGCPNTTTVTVSVMPLPIVNSTNDTICDGATAHINAIDSLGNIASYSWNTGSDSIAISDAPHQPVNTYTVVGYTSFGCADTSVSTIIVYPTPVVSVSSVGICQGASAVLTASGANSYTWSTGVVGNSITVSPVTTTSYSVTGKSSQGCSSNGAGIVKIGKKPQAGFVASPASTTIFDTEIAFSNHSSVDVVYWHWDYGDGDTLAPNTASPIHNYAQQAGTYTITLIVHNATPCWDTISSEIDISPEYAFYIPNCFTPNGDKNNNGFRGVGIGIVKYKLEIFDRWGQFIWQSTDLDEYWDGTVNGGTRIVEEDVYVWKVFITDVFGKAHQYIGTVTAVK